MGLDQSIFAIKKDLLKNPPKALEYDMFKQYLAYDEEDDYYYDLNEFAYWGRWHGLNLFILKYFSKKKIILKNISIAVVVFLLTKQLSMLLLKCLMKAN